MTMQLIARRSCRGIACTERCAVCDVASAMPVADALAIRNAAPRQRRPCNSRQRVARGGWRGEKALVQFCSAARSSAECSPLPIIRPRPVWRLLRRRPVLRRAGLWSPLRETGWRTACSGSGLMIRAAAHISALTASAIHVHDDAAVSHRCDERDSPARRTGCSAGVLLRLAARLAEISGPTRRWPSSVWVLAADTTGIR